MVKFIFFIGGLVFLGSCGSMSHFETDRSSQSYYSGGNRFFIPSLGSSLRSILNTEQNASNAQVSNRFPSNLEEEAAVGLLVSGLSLLVNSDYYKSNRLRVNCHCSHVHSNIDIPCTHITLALMDSQGRELERITSEEGSFSFPVSRNKTYRLGIISKKYQLKNPLSKTVEMGDSIALYLVSDSSSFAE